jgi:Prokaryotic homologs of the JAB domain
MKQITKMYLTREILDETSKSLRAYGERECEGLVLWLGHINNDDTCQVDKVMTPPQDSIRSEEGVGYFVTSETLFSLNKFLSSSGLRLLAQVHSHPGRAYHSGADDRYCIVTVEGGFSIVVPNFGFGPSDLHQWATHRLTNGTWERLSSREVRTTLIVDGEPEDNVDDQGFLSKIAKLFH